MPQVSCHSAVFCSLPPHCLCGAPSCRSRLLAWHSVTHHSVFSDPSGKMGSRHHLPPPPPPPPISWWNCASLLVLAHMCCSRAAQSPHPSLPAFCTTQHKLYRIENCSDGDKSSHVSLYLIRGSCLRLNLGWFNYNLSERLVCTGSLSCTPSVCHGEVSTLCTLWLFSPREIVFLFFYFLFFTFLTRFSLWWHR